MSVQVLPNSGIPMNDRLDGLRERALTVAGDGLPVEVAAYICAIESAYLNMICGGKKQALREIGWKSASPSQDGGR